MKRKKSLSKGCTNFSNRISLPLLVDINHFRLDPAGLRMVSDQTVDKQN
jgi:hypothetical protein